MKKLTGKWLEYSANDLAAARTLYQSSKPSFEIIAYHCQQSAEKNLKAILIEHNLTVPRTHGLKIVLQETSKISD
ncbi:HEPN domain-containing protein [Salinispira pacifica]|uniref:HEPN domain-containing protein n=1 Tax=Salinispira pacifica TaxID=1307761 RepID=UPI00040B0B6F|nr:HEPN domain-containing protein [Salinispira pacifica]